MTYETLPCYEKPPAIVDGSRLDFLNRHIITEGDIRYPKGLGMYYTGLNKNRYSKIHRRTVDGKRKSYYTMDAMELSNMAYRDYIFDIIWVALGTAWFEKGKDLRKINTVEQVRKAADIYSRYTNVFLWGYPQPDSIDEFISYMHDCTNIEHVKGWILNPEIGFKNEPEKARELVDKCRHVDPYMILGMSTYGAAHWHKDFPYDSFKGVDFASPQVYNFSKKLKQDSFREYDKIFKKVIPSTSLFQKNDNGKFGAINYKKLKKEFETTIAASDKPIDSIIMWQDAFHNASKKPLLQDYGTRLRKVGVEE